MRELGVDFEARFYDKEPFSAAELQKLIGIRSIDDFLNPRSPAYKKLGLGGKKITKKEGIRLIREDVNLMRRPLVVKGSEYIFGFDRAAYREL